MIVECCGDAKEERKKRVRLSFLMEELLYDIESYAYLEGDVGVGEKSHGLHQLIDIGQAGNVELVTRKLNRIWTDVRELLYNWSKRKLRGNVDRDDYLEEHETYDIELVVGDETSETTLDCLENLIHDYMVYRVVREWMLICRREDRAAAEAWELKAAEAYNGIKECLNRGFGHRRIRLHPF